MDFYDYMYNELKYIKSSYIDNDNAEHQIV